MTLERAWVHTQVVETFEGYLNGEHLSLGSERDMKIAAEPPNTHKSLLLNGK